MYQLAAQADILILQSPLIVYRDNFGTQRGTIAQETSSVDEEGAKDKVSLAVINPSNC
jgi:hypothetical protein